MKNIHCAAQKGKQAVGLQTSVLRSSRHTP